MGKKTTRISILIFVLVILGAVVLVKMQPRTLDEDGQELPTPTPSGPQHSVLYLTPNPFFMTETASMINVNIDPNMYGNNTVTGVRLIAKYDPKAITVTSVTPATFFKKYVIKTKTIDKTKGIITVEILSAPKTTGKKEYDTVFGINFTSQLEKGKSTKITVEKQTSVTAVGEKGSVLEAAHGVTITQQ